MTSGFKRVKRIEWIARIAIPQTPYRIAPQAVNLPGGLAEKFVEKSAEAEMCWLLICDGVRCRGSVSDGGAVDDELDAAVALTAVGGVICGDGLRFSKTVRRDGRRRNSLLGEKIADGIRAALGELLIEFIGAHAVRVAFNLQSQASMRQQNA